MTSAYESYIFLSLFLSVYLFYTWIVSLHKFANRICTSLIFFYLILTHKCHSFSYLPTIGKEEVSLVQLSSPELLRCWTLPKGYFPDDYNHNLSLVSDVIYPTYPYDIHLLHLLCTPLQPLTLSSCWTTYWVNIFYFLTSWYMTSFLFNVSLHWFK